MFSLPVVIHRLDQKVERALEHQIVDPSDPDHGAFVLPETGMPTADHTAGGAAALALCLVVLMDTPAHRESSDTLDRAEAAVLALRRLQRPTGLIDLPKVDYDSPPDTAFMVQAACPVLALAQRRAEAGDAAGERLGVALEGFVRSAATGVVGRGFRTPNHRWVVCSALAWAMTLLPDLDALPYVESILAEGIDINSEGVYSERSAGIYDTVCNRALRIMADHLDRPALLDHVRANLDYCLGMLDADGSILTAVSRRQDHGLSMTPSQMIDSLYDMAVRDNRGDYAAAADLIFDADTEASVFWPASWFALNPSNSGDQVARTPLPATLERFMPETAVWRVRDRRTSFAALSETAGFLTVRHGQAAIRKMGLRGSYFHRSVFVPETLEKTPSGVKLRYEAKAHRKPGWDLPLGRPVVFDHPEQYYRIAQTEREHHLLPELFIEVAIDRVEQGLDLRIRTIGGYERIAFVAEFWFEPGGRCVVDDQEQSATAGERRLLTAGHATVETGGDRLTLGPGGKPHTLAAMLEQSYPGDAFLVQIPMLTPVDQTLAIRWGE
ncbi:MAG: hypothetical protein AAGI68_15200 [Planctomycetota bacterium]